MRHPRTFALALAALAVTVLALATALDPAPPRPAAPSPGARAPGPPDEPPRPAGTPPPPALDRRTLERQDRVDPAHRRRESAVYDRRPLLDHLPLTRAGVTIDIAGLAADDSTLLTITHPGRSRAHARTVYRRALAAHHDRGRAYTVRYQP